MAKHLLNALTPSAVKGAKPQEKAYRMADGRGMFLLVNPNGSKWWRMKYWRPGTKKQNLLSLGVYPDVSLKQARERREYTRNLIADGIDPADQRKAETQADADTFEAVAREWFAKQSPQWAAGHADKIIARLERDLFPWLGGKPMDKITAPQLLAVVRRIEARGAIETAHRAMQNAGQIFRYAIATGRATSDPVPSLRGSLTPCKPQHHPSITEPDAVAELLRGIEGYTGTFPVACAMKLAPMFFVRPGELRTMQWADVDLDAAEWRYHVSKTHTDHIVPLATQAVAILRELYPMTGRGRYVFPGMRDRSKPLSDAAMNAGLRRIGYDQGRFTMHGFRAMARTILDEQLGYRPELIEHQLAHAVRDPLGRAYNRTKHLEARAEMMQGWADYLDALKRGADVIPFRRKA